MDTSTVKPGHTVSLKLAQMSTRAAVTDFYFFLTKNQ